MKYKEFHRYDRLMMTGGMLVQVEERVFKLTDIAMSEEHSKLVELLMEASSALHTASRELDRLIRNERDELIKFMKQ